jgi:hypothetical protein
MTFQLKPFRELVAMTEEKLLSLEARINESCARKELDFNAIGDLIDEYDLTERRLRQIKALIADLFPES